MANELNAGQRRIIQLIEKEGNQHGGWAKVSRCLYPLVREMPPELVETEADEKGGGRARLTRLGQEILNWI